MELLGADTGTDTGTDGRPDTAFARSNVGDIGTNSTRIANHLGVTYTHVATQRPKTSRAGTEDT
jgi:hypothetical protein